MAAQVRRRRLLLADLAFGLLLALLALAIAPGLAWVALVALIVLAGYAARWVVRRVQIHRRREARAGRSFKRWT
jgi:Flp pilus assembly protein TadB